MVYFTGTSRVYAALFNRVRRYRLIAASEASNATVGALLKALLGLLGMKQSGMPLGAVLGQAAANLLYRFRIPGLHLPKTSAAQRKEAARKHRNFPLFAAPKDFINSFSFNLPFLWLALYFDKAEVGLFGLALTFTMRPANVLNAAFERVLYARTAEQVRQRQSISRLIRRFLLYINMIAFPVCVVGWLFSEPLCAFFFGEEWGGSGVYIQTLLPWIFLSLSSASLTFIPNVFSTQRTEIFFYLALLGLRVAAVVVGIHAADFLTGIRLYATAGALVSASLLVWYVWQVRRYERSLPRK
jgi:O-antigen/teichoic acid export membrane protein